MPGEPEDEYDRMADTMRSLTHLEPPQMIRLQLDRFSPYHQQPGACGLEILGARRDFPFIYQVSAEILDDLVYSFEYRHTDGRDPESYTQEVRRVIESWREQGRGAIASLSYRRGPGFLVVTDRRPGLAPAEYRFDEAEADLYLAREDRGNGRRRVAGCRGRWDSGGPRGGHDLLGGVVQGAAHVRGRRPVPFPGGSDIGHDAPPSRRARRVRSPSRSWRIHGGLKAIRVSGVWIVETVMRGSKAFAARAAIFDALS